MQVNVDTVQSDQEVGEDVLLGLGDVGEEGGDEGCSVGELGIRNVLWLGNWAYRGVDGDEQLERLGVDISDLDTSLAAT